MGLTFCFRKHQDEKRQEAATQAEIATKRANARLAWNRLKQNWNADDDWELKLSAHIPSYSVDVERAIAKGHPILILGNIKDVRTNQDLDGETILIENHLSRYEYDLRFSLAASSDVAESIVASTRKNPLKKFDCFILVANIQNVTKTQGTDDRGYFLAHGTLLEAYPAQMLLMDSAELRSEPGTTSKVS